MKATFSISVVVDNDYIALSNMPEENVATLSDGKKEYQFKKSVKMSTYLVW
jgi:aminopeptidase N